MPATTQKLNEAIRIMADEAEKVGGEPNDENGVVRGIVLGHGLSFNAWFCVCCELADRSARRDGFKDSIDHAAQAAFGRKR